MPIVVDHSPFGLIYALAASTGRNIGDLRRKREFDEATADILRTAGVVDFSQHQRAGAIAAAANRGRRGAPEPGPGVTTFSGQDGRVPLIGNKPADTTSGRGGFERPIQDFTDEERRTGKETEAGRRMRAADHLSPEEKAIANDQISQKERVDPDAEKTPDDLKKDFDRGVENAIFRDDDGVAWTIGKDGSPVPHKTTEQPNTKYEINEIVTMRNKILKEREDAEKERVEKHNTSADVQFDEEGLFPEIKFDPKRAMTPTPMEVRQRLDYELGLAEEVNQDPDLLNKMQAHARKTVDLASQLGIDITAPALPPALSPGRAAFDVPDPITDAGPQPIAEATPDLEPLGPLDEFMGIEQTQEDSTTMPDDTPGDAPAPTQPPPTVAQGGIEDPGVLSEYEEERDKLIERDGTAAEHEALYERYRKKDAKLTLIREYEEMKKARRKIKNDEKLAEAKKKEVLKELKDMLLDVRFAPVAGAKDAIRLAIRDIKRDVGPIIDSITNAPNPMDLERKLRADTSSWSERLGSSIIDSITNAPNPMDLERKLRAEREEMLRQSRVRPSASGANQRQPKEQEPEGQGKSLREQRKEARKERPISVPKEDRPSSWPKEKSLYRQFVESQIAKPTGEPAHDPGPLPRHDPGPLPRKSRGKKRGVNLRTDSRPTGKRRDGSDKHPEGFLGVLKGSDGKVSTELSVSFSDVLNNKEIPLLVPGQIGVKDLLSGGNPTKAQERIAIDHARKRAKGGLSPFREPNEVLPAINNDANKRYDVYRPKGLKPMISGALKDVIAKPDDLTHLWSHTYQTDGSKKKEEAGRKALVDFKGKDVPADGKEAIDVAVSIFGSDKGMTPEVLARTLRDTSIMETGFRTRKQDGDGPARGYAQVEPATAKSLAVNSEVLFGKKFKSIFPGVLERIQKSSNAEISKILENDERLAMTFAAAKWMARNEVRASLTGLGK